MRFVVDPAIAVKIQKMQERVQWQSPMICDRGIDQTRLVLADERSDDPEFSFLVIGDSGSGQHRSFNPQRRIAEQMLLHREECRFVLHTGDVIYLVGSSEFYLKNFIEPYREFLVGGTKYEQIAHDQMVFNLPFLPVPGNHDYYDLPLLYGLAIQLTYPIRRLLQSKLDFDIGWHGSFQGKAYAQAFLDQLRGLSGRGLLEEHLDRHYTAKTETGRCLYYEPGKFTRLPNRYYTFRQGNVDFFGLDSNTFNEPAPLPKTHAGQAYRQTLETRYASVELEMQQLIEESDQLNPNQLEEAERIDDIRTKLEQLEEIQRDISKQLTADESIVTDIEQLDWLRDRLIQSWHTPGIRGRVLFFHHPPYVTEATKWHQAQTLAIRRRLRQVLDQVAKSIGSLPEGRSIVDLVLNGHAHCFEYLKTVDTGHADSHTHWIVCGGSGYSLRRQRVEGEALTESRDGTWEEEQVAQSHLFVGREGRGAQKRRPYSFVRIDVQAGEPLRFLVRPYVSERLHGVWSDRALPAFLI
ncbi:MAG: metallophosphoesterase [Leptolyngbyaceae cyanobacterium CSU_1_3]|nr:metallophosphoesterase [Leptolyngbyaceae cyanobacterium CSU_1_3]